MTTSRQITANDVAWPNIVALDLDPTGATDSSPALNAHITAAISAAASHRYQQINIYIPAGKYQLLSQIVKRSYISIISLGMVVLDFSASSLNGVACIRDYNDAETHPSTPSINAAANRRVGLNGDNGVIDIIAPPTALACLDVGQETDTSNNDYREVTPCRNVYMYGAQYGMVIREIDTYMLTVEKTKLTGATAAVRFGSPGSPSNVNSGEKIVFTDCVLVAFTPSGVGLDFYCNDWGVFINNSSIDFMFGMAARINTDVKGIHLHYSLCHFERCVDNGLVVSYSTDPSASQNSVTIDNCYLLPTNRSSSDGFSDAQVRGARTDGKSISRAPLFQGLITLAFTNNRIQGYFVSGSGGDKADGVYFCDDSVIVAAWTGNTFYGFPQSVSGSRAVNQNAVFDPSLTGTSLINSHTPGWLVSSYANLAAQFVTTTVWDSTAPTRPSLQIGPATTTSDWINIEGDLIPWENQPLTSELILWAGSTSGTSATTGSITITWTFETWARKAKQSMSPSIVKKNSGTTAIVTTSSPHGLESGEIINMYGAAQPEFNTRGIVTKIDDTNFTYPVVNPSVVTATGALNYTVEQGGLTLLTAAASGTVYTRSLYTADPNAPTPGVFSDTSDPLNNIGAGRNRWIRMPLKARLDSNNVVPGTQFVRPKIFITNMNDGDTIFIGAMQVLRS